jgi:hypothetical protein
MPRTVGTQLARRARGVVVWIIEGSGGTRVTKATTGPGEAPTAGPAADGFGPIRYEPPAIAWEEQFEAMAAATCAMYPVDPNCEGDGQTG